MFAKTLDVARQYGAKAAVLPAVVLTSVAARAEGEAASGTTILAQVENSLSTGASIATAVVVGMFVIFGIKLLWRSK